jgi:hypothetical protein
MNGVRSPSMAQVHQAIEVIGQMFQRYYSLFEAASVEVEPLVPHDWERAFTVPWLDRGVRAARINSEPDR